MRTLKIMGFALMIMAAIVIGGDVFNLPLWPIDFFWVHIPVEIRISTSDETQDALHQVLSQQTSPWLHLLSKGGKELQILKPDRAGVARTVLPVGHFYVKGSLSGVYEGVFYAFVTCPRTSDSSSETDSAEQIIGIAFSCQSEAVDLQLCQRKSTSDDSIKKNLIAMLSRGDIESATALIPRLDSDAADDVQRLKQYVEEKKSLRKDAYNAHIKILQESKNILAKYVTVKDQEKLLIDGESIDLSSKIESIRTARNMVIEAYVRLMNEFQAEGQLDAIMEIWMQFANNPDLEPSDETERATLPSSINPFYLSMQEIRSAVVTEMTDKYDNGIHLFDTGELLKARSEFTHLLRSLRNLSLKDEFPSMELDIQGYLNDISVILAANDAVKEGRFQEAFDLFGSVTHVNQIVQRRIDETQRFMQMQSTAASERSDD